LEHDVQHDDFSFAAVIEANCFQNSSDYSIYRVGQKNVLLYFCPYLRLLL